MERGCALTLTVRVMNSRRSVETPASTGVPLGVVAWACGSHVVLICWASRKLRAKPRLPSRLRYQGDGAPSDIKSQSRPIHDCTRINRSCIDYVLTILFIVVANILEVNPSFFAVQPTISHIKFP
ncbi:hypothetical protein F5X97DRAFT_121225 [Nemania serpens]|nr:hypothetical protein F5X97DRAFT_121225 [Nemania serpens]